MQDLTILVIVIAKRAIWIIWVVIGNNAGYEIRRRKDLYTQMNSHRLNMLILQEILVPGAAARTATTTLAVWWRQIWNLDPIHGFI
jgi:hypothetical protein